MVEAIRALDINAEDALVSLQEGQRAVMLKIEIQRTDDLLFELDELLAAHLFSEQLRQFVNHHIEARIHVLVHLGGQ